MKSQDVLKRPLRHITQNIGCLDLSCNALSPRVVYRYRHLRFHSSDRTLPDAAYLKCKTQPLPLTGAARCFSTRSLREDGNGSSYCQSGCLIPRSRAKRWRERHAIRGYVTQGTGAQEIVDDDDSASEPTQNRDTWNDSVKHFRYFPVGDAHEYVMPPERRRSSPYNPLPDLNWLHDDLSAPEHAQRVDETSLHGRQWCPLVVTANATAEDHHLDSPMFSSDDFRVGQNWVDNHPQLFNDTLRIRRTKSDTSTLAPLSDFESAVAGAESRPRDDKQNRAVARIKSGRDFKPRYFYAHRASVESRKRNEQRAAIIQKKRLQYPTNDDWRHILHRLDENTPTHPRGYQKQAETVNLPAGVAAVFRRDPSRTILEIVQRTGCHIQAGPGVGRYKGRQEAFSSVTLQGSSSETSRAIELLPQFLDILPRDGFHSEDDIHQLVLERRHQRRVHTLDDAVEADTPYGGASDFERQDDLSELDIEKLENMIDNITGSKDVAIALPPTVSIPMRSVWAEDRRRSRHILQSLKSLPDSGSAIALTAYINELTQSVPRLLRRQLYKDSTPGSVMGHVDIVTERLMALFETPNVIANVPSAAVTRTVHFLTKHTKFPQFRKLLANLRSGGYRFDAANWNACLAAAARAGDIHNFKLTLTAMWLEQVKPSPITWALFHQLMCKRFPLEAGIAVEAMRNKGLLLDNKAAQQVAANMASNELAAHLALRGHLDAFYRLYDNRFGVSYGLTNFNWLSLSVAKGMIKPLLATGKVQDAFHVIDELKRRNHGKTLLDTATLNIFLAAALRDEDMQSAIGFLQHFQIGEPQAMTPDHITYHILFSIAWRQRYFNVLRVVWRHACTAGHVTSGMRYRMLKSLADFAPDQPETTPAAKTDREQDIISRGRVWRSWAGKFAAGVAEGLPDAAIPFSIPPPSETLASRPPSSHEEEMLRRASDHLLPPNEHAQRFASLRNLLDKDLDEVTNSIPTLPLTSLLEQALQQDLVWKRIGLGSPKCPTTTDIPTAADLHSDLATMLREGIFVAVRPGDATSSSSRAREVPWESPAIAAHLLSRGPEFPPQQKRTFQKRTSRARDPVVSSERRSESP